MISQLKYSRFNLIDVNSFHPLPHILSCTGCSGGKRFVSRDHHSCWLLGLPGPWRQPTLMKQETISSLSWVSAAPVPPTRISGAVSRCEKLYAPAYVGKIPGLGLSAQPGPVWEAPGSGQPIFSPLIEEIFQRRCSLTVHVVSAPGFHQCIAMEPQKHH